MEQDYLLKEYKLYKKSFPKETLEDFYHDYLENIELCQQKYNNITEEFGAIPSIEYSKDINFYIDSKNSYITRLPHNNINNFYSSEKTRIIIYGNNHIFYEDLKLMKKNTLSLEILIFCCRRDLDKNFDNDIKFVKQVLDELDEYASLEYECSRMDGKSMIAASINYENPRMFFKERIIN